MSDYEISEVRRAWKRNGIRYRRVITTDGDTIVEKGVGDRYVADYVTGPAEGRTVCSLSLGRQCVECSSEYDGDEGRETAIGWVCWGCQP